MTNTEASVVPTQADREAAASCVSVRKHKALILTGAYDDSSTVQAFARHRLAHQAPPATQPSAGVGEVERALFDMIDGFSEFMDIVPAERAKMRERARAFITLHTPPPVATATVVDALRQIADGLPGQRAAHRFSAARQIARDALAATPTPQAGDQ